MIHRRWSSDHLVKALFDQDKVWIDRFGTVHQIEDMKLDHIFNTLLMLERMVEDFPFDDNDLQSKPLYQALYARVLKALTPEASKPKTPEPPMRGWYTTPPGIRRLLESCMPSAGTLAERVVIDYTVDDGTRAERTIEPCGIQDRRGDLAVQPFLVAKKAETGELRTYRLDRIHRARLA